MGILNLTVMTFNIHHGKGTDHKVNLERTIDLIQKSKADIIGLNEVDRYFSKRSNYVDQVSYLANKLHMYQAFGATFTRKIKELPYPSEFGNAILSRFPIISYKNTFFNFYKGVIEGRGLLHTTLQIKGILINLLVTHLSLNPYFHRKQTKFILEHVNPKLLPTIILGDWNMKPHSTAWKMVTNSYRDVGQSSTRKIYTFPANQPRSQLDYIFVSKHFQIGSTSVYSHNPAISDHLPLIASLHLKD